jgi:cysteine-rich repeat protein
MSDARATASRVARVVTLLGIACAWAACLPPDELYGRPCDTSSDCAGELERTYVCQAGMCVDESTLAEADAGQDVDAGVPSDGGLAPDAGSLDAGAIDGGAGDGGVPLVESVCDDLVDDDADGAPDCADTDCQATAVCVPGVGALGSPCTAATGCTSTGTDPVCLTERFSGVPGGACAEWCDVAAQDCAAGAACVATSFGVDVGVCVDTCDTDVDCTPPFECRAYSGALACLMPGCDDDQDCAVTGKCHIALGACVDLPVCGDGALQLGETCDDGNLIAGDGCGLGCRLEGGIVCAGEPSVCVPLVCGDGQVDAPEPCDDGNANALDGCTAACTVGDGYVCVAEPSRCAQLTGNWSCFPWDFGDGVCDCGCGAVDVDCALPLAVDDCERGCGGGLVSPNDPTACVPPACGNGLIEPLEGCDDANVAAGDGCDAACAIEGGYSCSGAPSSCVGVPVSFTCPAFLYSDGDACDCGCGTVDPDCQIPVTVEQCDRVNCVYGDYLDETSTHLCLSPVCGDGVIMTIEGCDDGNALAGDGCADTCFVEAAFACHGEPSVCGAVVCGDGFVDDVEGCDDGALVDGDGCSATCALEPDFVCGGEPSLCVLGWTCIPSFYGDGICDCGCALPDPDCAVVVDVNLCYNNCTPGVVDPDDFTLCLADVCGDGVKGFAEDCDDGDNLDGDGCSLLCVVEDGFVCIGSPSWCRPIVCGDGAREGSEACDDGNATAGDGCTSCTIDSGFGCVGSPSSCASIVCGDGIITVGEGCDDANDVAGDGCSSTCLVEPNATCSGQPSVCRVVPPEWTCPPLYYDNDDGCDCGCVVTDPDCPDATAAVCEFCSEVGSCNTLPDCPGDIAPNNNATCIF